MSDKEQLIETSTATEEEDVQEHYLSQPCGVYPKNSPPYEEAMPNNIPDGQPVISPPPSQSHNPQPFMDPINVHVYKDESTLTESDNFTFSSKTIRHAFIRKVYGILMCQLLVTVGFITLFLYNKPTKEFVQTNYLIWSLSYLVAFIFLIALACCENIRRKYPTNFICLGIFTLFMSFCIGTISSYFDSEEVLMAIGVTTAISFSLIIFAFQTKWDFTLLRGVVYVILIVYIIYGNILIFYPGRSMPIFYSSIGVVIFSLYLVYDTQLMIGGRHKYALSPEEYVFAALCLYLDIINLFLLILRIIR